MTFVSFLFPQTFSLLHEEGFFVGASSGLNVAAAVKVRYVSVGDTQKTALRLQTPDPSTQTYLII